MKKKKVSVDFDHTLSYKEVQQLVVLLLKNDIDVWVTTTRYEDVNNYNVTPRPTHNDLIKVITKVGIPFHKVKFTNMEWKDEYLKTTDFIWHLDDNPTEIALIKKNTNVEPILYGKKKWRKSCLEILKNI